LDVDVRPFPHGAVLQRIVRVPGFSPHDFSIQVVDGSRQEGCLHVPTRNIHFP
jgi:hypothetical protein